VDVNLLTILTGRPVGMDSHKSDIWEIIKRCDDHTIDSNAAADINEIHDLRQLHCNENPIYLFLFWELRGLSPNFHIQVFVSDLYIPRNSPHIWLQQDRPILEISHRYMSLGIGR
jgi:hypothetical protein